MNDRLPCKSLVNEKARDSCTRSGERVVAVIRTCRSRTFCLSADGSCVYAEPDIHVRSRAAKSCHRRLSLCSLPVPKQLVESLGSCLRRPAGHLRDLAACASSNPDVFPFFRKGFYTAAAGENSPAGMKPVPRLSTASMCATMSDLPCSRQVTLRVGVVAKSRNAPHSSLPFPGRCTSSDGVQEGSRSSAQ